MENFNTKAYKTYREAIEYIRKVLEKRGTDYQLCPPLDEDEDIDDSFYELPFTFFQNKYGENDIYRITSINIDEHGNLEFVGVLEENVDNTYFFTQNEVSMEAIFDIADMLLTFENQ